VLQRSKDLAANPKVRMIHMHAFHGVFHSQGNASKSQRSRFPPGEIVVQERWPYCRKLTGLEHFESCPS
jgi:hypothetical protein